MNQPARAVVGLLGGIVFRRYLLLLALVGCVQPQVTQVEYVAPPPVVLAAAATEPARDPNAWTTTADIVLAPSGRSARVTQVAADVDWAHTAPSGYGIMGTHDLTRRERDGTGDHAALYPGGRPLPIAHVDGFNVRFSPDGRFAAILSNNKPTRAGHGTPWTPARPMISIMTIPDMRVTDRVYGGDAQWIGSSTVAFRQNRQAYRLDIGRGASATPIGIPQTQFACTEESFAPSSGVGTAGCRDDVWTSVIAIDPAMQHWLVVDDSQSKHTGALRLLGLADGSSRIITSAHDIGTTMTAPTYSTSPSSARMCGWSIVHVPTQTSTLFCASLSDGVPENIATFDGEGPSFDWLDDQRIIVQRGGGWVIVDLVRRTYTRVLGAPFDASKASLRTLGATGKRFVAGSAVVDLESRSYTTFNVPAASISVEWNPGNDRRFSVIERGNNVPKNRAFWVDL